MNERPLVITHANCMDGFCAAWVLVKALGEETFLFNANYGDMPPAPEILAGRPVYMVDFSYPRAEMRAIATIAGSLTVFDHHESAQMNLAGLEEELRGEGLDVRIVFDMERSGAGITWDEMHEGARRPWVVLYTEDRDLWRFRFRNSKAVNAYIETIPLEVQEWDKLAAMDVKDIMSRGEGIVAYQEAYCRKVHMDGHPVTFQGLPAVVVNAHYVALAEVLGHILEVDAGIEVAVGWFLRGDGRYKYSVRTREGGPRANDLAAAYGGGGHVTAAGFTAEGELEFDGRGEAQTDPD